MALRQYVDFAYYRDDFGGQPLLALWESDNGEILTNRTFQRATRQVDNLTFDRIPDTEWEDNDLVKTAVCVVADILYRRTDPETGAEKRVITQERLDTTYREYKATADTNKGLAVVIREAVEEWLLSTGLMAAAAPYKEGRWACRGFA